MPQIEVEIKAKLDNFAQIKPALKKLGARYVCTKHQSLLFLLFCFLPF